ncbi:peptidoglycan editing factor PgeF [Pseudomonadota bacterium]|nr:peptidoglycan editing factor PgeF [Pseudomonadota bacterium]
MTNQFIHPDWPAPKNIQAISTTRNGGFSQGPFDSLNLGSHVGDTLSTVLKNRYSLLEQASLPEPPRWLNQVHSSQLISANDWQGDDSADAIVSSQENQVCAVMTADCLPILLCNTQGDHIAAIHAGWRGLSSGILENTLQQFNCEPSEVIAWFGPAIGPDKFEVGLDVVEAFTRNSSLAHKAFKQVGESHYLADIYLLARQKLIAYGTHAIFGGTHCTASEPEHFFSYRRDGTTGRMASMIWITHN